MSMILSLCTGMLGLFLAVPLLAMRRARPANLWLGLWLVAFSMLALADIYDILPKLFGLFDWPLFALGPCYYLYARVLTGRPATGRDAWHFLPTALWALTLAIGLLIVPRQDFLNWLFRGRPPVFAGILLAGQFQAGLYSIVVIRHLWRTHQRVKQHYASMEGRDLRWLLGVSSALLFLLLAWIPGTLAGGIWTLILIVGRLVVLFGLGWSGLRQAAVFLSSAPVEVRSEKYARSGMNEGAKELIAERLARNRDFLNNDITLASLAERIGTSPQWLSQYLNEDRGQSFYDYVNALRVAEVQEMLRQPESQEKPLLELAFAAGFNSKSTFNAAFKKVTGLAPSQWRASLPQTSVPIG